MVAESGVELFEGPSCEEGKLLEKFLPKKARTCRVKKKLCLHLYGVVQKMKTVLPLQKFDFEKTSPHKAGHSKGAID